MRTISATQHSCKTKALPLVKIRIRHLHIFTARVNSERQTSQESTIYLNEAAEICIQWRRLESGPEEQERNASRKKSLTPEWHPSSGHDHVAKAEPPPEATETRGGRDARSTRKTMFLSCYPKPGNEVRGCKACAVYRQTGSTCELFVPPENTIWKCLSATVTNASVCFHLFHVRYSNGRQSFHLHHILWPRDVSWRRLTWSRKSSTSVRVSAAFRCASARASRLFFNSVAMWPSSWATLWRT